MKLNKLLFSAICILLSIQSFAQPAPPEGLNWVAVEAMSDEFNGTFDTSKWFNSTWNYGGTSPVSMVPENSGVSDGNLWIKATDNGKPNDQRWFQTARVHSVAKISYPMYTECRVRTAHISAYNTFWLNNGDINNRDEIDIIENNSKPSCNCQPNFPWQMNSQYFQATNGVTVRNADNFDNRNLPDSNPKKGVKWNEEYHVVGAWWKDEKNIQFYLNGEPAGSVVVGEDRNGGNDPSLIFTRDLEIIWDLWTADEPWLGGLAVRSDLADDTINTMYVDWVHTFSLEGTATDRVQSIVWDNKADYVIENETRPVFEPGETISITSTYATSTTAGEEADLSYVAMHIRELDESGGVVRTSPFMAVINGSEANTNTTTYDFTLPTNFDDTTLIPTIENLDAGHKLILLFYMQEDAGPLVDTNTEIILTNDKVAYSQTLSIDAVTGNGNKASVSPNPFTDIITIENVAVASWELFDLNGKSIATGTNNTVDASAFNNGLYILVVNDTNVIKVIKN